MNELPIADLLSTPLGLLAVTIVVAAITAAIVARMMRGSREEPVPAAAPVPAPRRSEPPVRSDSAIIAAISAAVYAALGPHRIVYVSAVRPASGWTTEVRTQHHTSHVPHAPHSNPTHR